MNKNNLFVVFLLFGFLFFVCTSQCTQYPIAVSNIENCINGVCDATVDTVMRIPLKSGAAGCIDFLVGNTTQSFTLNVTAAEQVLQLDQYMHCGDVSLYSNTSCSCSNVPSSCTTNFVPSYRNPLNPNNYKTSVYGASSGCLIPSFGADYCVSISPSYDFRFDSYTVTGETNHFAFVATNDDVVTKKVWDGSGVLSFGNGPLTIDINMMSAPRASGLVNKMIVNDVRERGAPRVITNFNDVSSKNLLKFCHSRISGGAIDIDWLGIKRSTVVRPLNCYSQFASLELNALNHIHAYNDAPTINEATKFDWSVFFTEDAAKNTFQSTGILPKVNADFSMTREGSIRRFGFVEYPSNANRWIEFTRNSMQVFDSPNAITGTTVSCASVQMRNAGNTGNVAFTMKIMNGAFFAADSVAACNAVQLDYGGYTWSITTGRSELNLIDQAGQTTLIKMSELGLSGAVVSKDAIYREQSGSATALVAIRGKMTGVKFKVEAACISPELTCTVVDSKLLVDLVSTCANGLVYVSFNETTIARAGYVTSGNDKTPFPLLPNIASGPIPVLTTACTAAGCGSCVFSAPANYTITKSAGTQLYDAFLSVPGLPTIAGYLSSLVRPFFLLLASGWTIVLVYEAITFSVAVSLYGLWFFVPMGNGMSKLLGFFLGIFKNLSLTYLVVFRIAPALVRGIIRIVSSTIKTSKIPTTKNEKTKIPAIPAYLLGASSKQKVQ